MTTQVSDSLPPVVAGPDASPRCAVYAAPAPGSAFWQRGSQWLGRCAATGQSMSQPMVPGVSPRELWCLTRTPRRYGWHATLKAPFRPALGVTQADVLVALRHLAQTLHPVVLPPLTVAMLGDFLALVPKGGQAAVQALADACVQGLHPLAAPLTPAELARRRATGLSPREDELLLAWGYPHVQERFRFHFSLTGSLSHVSDATRQALTQAAQDWFVSDTEWPLCLDALSLFDEPAPGADFRCLCRAELAA